jgi:hypothetical protein
MAKTIYFSAPAGLTLAAAAHADPTASGTAASAVTAQTLPSVYAATFADGVTGDQLIRVTRSGVDLDLLVASMPAAGGSAWAIPRVWLDVLSTAAVTQIAGGILLDTTKKLLTDADGKVTTTSGGGGGASAADIRSNLLDLFKAITRSNVSAPVDLGGTFNPATDSLEALQAQFASAYAATTGQRATARNALTYYLLEEIPQTITLPDSSLAGETLRLVIDEGTGADRVTLHAADVTVSGSTVTFTNDAAVTARDRTARWALRGQTADGRKVHFHGLVSVRVAAREAS